jgi:hypothetical protein
MEGAVFGNEVTVVFNCDQVLSPTPDCCKRDIRESYCKGDLAKI